MTTLMMKMPEALVEYERDTTRFIAAKLYEAGKISLGQGAEMVGLSVRTFAELLGDYKVSILNYPAEEIIADARG